MLLLFIFTDEEDEVKTNGSVKDTWEDVEKRKIVVKAEWDDEDDDDVKDSWDLDEPVAPSRIFAV